MALAILLVQRRIQHYHSRIHSPPTAETHSVRRVPIPEKRIEVQPREQVESVVVPHKPEKDDAELLLAKKDSAEVKRNSLLEENKKSVVCGGHTARSCAECPRGQDGSWNGEGWCNGECRWDKNKCIDKPSYVHDDYYMLLKEYPFQPVANNKGEYVNIIMVRSPFRSQRLKELYLKYKDEILFLGISSFESFPLSSPNPFSANFSNDEYRALFPGFLTMMHHPEEYFDPSVKTILLSQSDFNLDGPLKFGKTHDTTKKYDFTFSGTDQDVHKNCVGWSSFAKNWTFVLEALEVMCSDEFNLKGVLVATKDKQGKRACSIPESCNGKMVQTTFLSNQHDFFSYVAQSKFAFIPQVYDASPRVTTQALSMNVPLLMNDNIVGGWKYLNEKTGEFFHDIHDFKSRLRKLLESLDTYAPRDYVSSNYGNEISGVKFKDFVIEHWGDRVTLPEGTKWLVPSGA
jgi:hypothetical protein